MLSDRLAVSCDHEGCLAVLISGPLEFHGTSADVQRLKAHAAEQGWLCVAQMIPEDEGPVVGPWHFCPLHRVRKGGG